MDKKTIIDKVQKLLALANSSNENEAKQAAALAQKILTKHNLTMAEVEKENRKYAGLEVPTGRKRHDPSWKFVQSIVRSYFFVEIVSSKKRKPKNFMDEIRTGIEFELIYVVFGEHHNIEIAKYVIDFLSSAFPRLFRQYRKATGAGPETRNSYYMGLYQGLHEQLASTQKQVEQEVGLVVVEDGLLKQFVQDSMKTKTTPHKPIKADEDALFAGYEQGKNLHISRGLEGDSRQNDQIGVTLKLGGNQ